MGVKEALKSQREYYGRVNAAFAFAECADQLADVLTQYENNQEDNGLLGSAAKAATGTELHDETFKLDNTHMDTPEKKPDDGAHDHNWRIRVEGDAFHSIETWRCIECGKTELHERVGGVRYPDKTSGNE